MSQGLLRHGMALSGVALLAAGLVLWGPGVFSTGSSAAQPPAADDNPFAVPTKPDAAPKKLDKPRLVPNDDDPFAPGPAVAKKPGIKPESKGASAPGGPPTSPPPRPPRKPEVPFTGGEAAIEKALAAPTKAEFTETPLSDVVDYFADLHRIPIVLDQRAMEEVAIDPSTVQITFSSRAELSFRSVLDLILRQHLLTWTVRSEVLLITSQDAAESMLVTKVYDVADLVRCRDEKDVPWDDYDSLIDAIESTVSSDSWQDTGAGPASIVGGTFGDAHVLIVSQTYRLHTEVAKMLEDLRKIGAKSEGDQKPPMRPRPKDDPQPRQALGIHALGGGVGKW